MTRDPLIDASMVKLAKRKQLRKEMFEALWEKRFSQIPGLTHDQAWVIFYEGCMCQIEIQFTERIEN